MTPASMAAYAAALFSGALALAVVLLTRRRSIAVWCFVTGMMLLGIESALAGLSIMETVPGNVKRWQTISLMASSFTPAVWLAFSLAYSRGDSRRYLIQWRFVLAAALVIPVGLALGFRTELVREIVPHGNGGGGWWIRYGPAARVLSLLGIVLSAAILANVEKTFRAAVGTMQWRIKFAVLGIGLIFGARIYTGIQDLLFAGDQLNRCAVDACALIIGCALLMIAHMRRGFAEVEIYPSRTVLQNSVTLLLVGAYVFIVGVLAQSAASLGGIGNFRLQTLVVLAGVTILAALLLSERMRQKLQVFVSRHFHRPRYDSRAIWTRFTQGLSNVFDQGAYCAQTVRLLAETFNTLSVTLLLIDDVRGRLTLGASTLLGQEAAESNLCPGTPGPLLAGLRGVSGPFDPDTIEEAWAGCLRHPSLSHFREGGKRICLPLLVGERGLGVAIMADRVNGIPYSLEELDILKCIGDHVSAGLFQLRLTEELMQNRELGAFQAMSTFFVHDLKNATSSLSLLSRNLQEHFDDPDFREDALRAVGTNVNRINQIIERLGSLRQKLELAPVEVNLNQLVCEMIDGLGGLGKIDLAKDLGNLPPIEADRGQLESLVTNLLVNAREALGPNGRITVETSRHDGGVMLAVADDGCGMTAAFMKDSLFRPFHTTKKKGLGIGMFQSRLIVEAHRGSMQVDSEPGRGTTFRVILPLTPNAP